MYNTSQNACPCTIKIRLYHITKTFCAPMSWSYSGVGRTSYHLETHLIMFIVKGVEYIQPKHIHKICRSSHIERSKYTGTHRCSRTTGKISSKVVWDTYECIGLAHCKLVTYELQTHDKNHLSQCLIINRPDTHLIKIPLGIKISQQYVNLPEMFFWYGVAILTKKSNRLCYFWCCE